MNPRQKTLLAAGWAILEDYATVARQSGVKAVADVGELAWRSAEAIKDVLYQHSSWVTIITEAYEGGVGKGQQARSLGREIENPWAEGMARTAWQKGYEVGRAQPENPLAEHWREQYEWAFHGWEECKKVCDALRDDLVQRELGKPVLQALAEAPTQAEARDKRYSPGGVFVPNDIAWGIVGSTGHARKSAVDALHALLKAEQAAEPAGYIHPQALERLKNGETVVFRKEPYGGEKQIPVYLEPREAQAPNPELVDLCHAIVDLHKSNGCVLTVQIEQMAELLEEPKKGGTQ